MPERLHDTATEDLNKAVKRDFERFSADFMFHLSLDEAEGLRFLSGTSESERGT